MKTCAAAVLALAAALLAGCGGGTARPAGADLPAVPAPPGWAAVADPPGIAELAPDLSGLRVTSVGQPPALARRGDAVRRAVFVFASDRDAAEAVKRAGGDDYLKALEKAFPADTATREPAGGIRLRVQRPAEPGFDTVELFLRRAGARVTLTALVSDRGFPPRLRAEFLSR
jgi:predicted small secreted protein